MGGGLTPMSKNGVPARDGLVPSRGCGGGAQGTCPDGFVTINASKVAGSTCDFLLSFSTIPVSGITVDKIEWTLSNGITSSLNTITVSLPTNTRITVSLVITLSNGLTCTAGEELSCQTVCGFINTTAITNWLLPLPSFTNDRGCSFGCGSWPTSIVIPSPAPNCTIQVRSDTGRSGFLFCFLEINAQIISTFVSVSISAVTVDFNGVLDGFSGGATYELHWDSVLAPSRITVPYVSGDGQGGPCNFTPPAFIQLIRL